MFDTIDAFLEVWGNYLYDKGYIHHFVFGILIALPFFYIFRHQNTEKQRLFALIWGVVCLLAPLTIEVGQYFLPERTFDFFDAFSSVLGSGLIYYLSQRRKGYAMKSNYRFSLVLALIFMIPCLSYAADQSKEPTGFIEIRFGQTKADFLSDYGPESAWKKGDNPFKDVGVDTIETEEKNTSMSVDFYKDRLFSICAGYMDITDTESKTIFSNIIEKYGVPDKLSGDDKNSSATWMWNKSIAFFSYFPEKRAVFFVVSDREVANIIVREQKKKEEKPKAVPEVIPKAAPKGNKSSL